ncbi:hypothetical protein Tco_1401422 [Tanacetum coccineum]
MHTIEEKVDMSKALDASLVDTENIRPIYDEELMAEVQTTAEINVFAIGQQHTEQPEFNNEGEVDQNAEQCHDTCPLPAKLTDNQKLNSHINLSNLKIFENETLKRHYKELLDSIKTMSDKTIEHTTSLITQNAEFKAQLQEKGFAIAALKNELRKLTGNGPTAFKFERPRISKPQFASQVDVNNDLSKQVTTHYLPKEREYVVVKPHHMIAPSSSRFSSNDMVHNHYLEEAKKKTQELGRNSRPSVMPSAKS